MCEWHEIFGERNAINSSFLWCFDTSIKSFRIKIIYMCAPDLFMVRARVTLRINQIYRSVSLHVRHGFGYICLNNWHIYWLLGIRVHTNFTKFVAFNCADFELTWFFYNLVCLLSRRNQSCFMAKQKCIDFHTMKSLRRMRSKKKIPLIKVLSE